MIVPPRKTEALLEALGAPSRFREEILGDLAEEFALRAALDASAARRWYYREALRATPHLLRSWWGAQRTRDLINLAGVVLTAYVGLMILGFIIVAMLTSVTSELGVSAGSYRVDLSNPYSLLALLALGSVGPILGGFLAAWLNDRAPLVAALALGTVWLALSVLTTARVGVVLPLWYRAAVLAVILAGTAAGGVLRVLRSRKTDGDAKRGARTVRP